MKTIIIGVVLFVILGLIAGCSSGLDGNSQPAPSSPISRPPEVPPNTGNISDKIWGNTQALAQKEGRIVIYLDAADSPIRDSFTKAIKVRTGLEPEILVARGAELSTKIIREQKAGLFNTDIFIGGGTSMYNLLKPAGVLGDLESNLILPEVKDPSNWKNGKLPWVDKNKTIMVFGIGTVSTAEFNTRLVRRDELTSYYDLLNPKWKGKIVMNDPTTPGKGNSWFMGTEKQVGIDFLHQLAKQEPVVIRDQRQQAEWLAQGKYPLGVGLLEEVLLEFINNGAPLDWITFKEGSYITGRANQLSIITHPPHPNASKVFINWFLSKDGQNMWSKEIISVSQRKDASSENVPAVNVPRSGVQYADQTTEEAMLERDKILEQAKEIFGQLIR